MNTDTEKSIRAYQFETNKFSYDNKLDSFIFEIKIVFLNIRIQNKIPDFRK